jgi:hypothetical protein
MTTRRGFSSALAATLLVSAPITSEARGGQRGGVGGRRSSGGNGGGGNSGGCGSRGGAGYRKANGKCAGRNE